MAIVRVQGNARGTSTSGNTITVNLANTPIAGNLLIAAIGCSRSASVTVSSISQTNVTWTKQVNIGHSNSVVSWTEGEIWAGVVGTYPGTAIVITLSATTTYGSIADVCEYSGLLTVGFLDKTATNFTATSGSTTDTGTTAETTQADELWIGEATAVQSPARTHNSATNGFTLLDGATGVQYTSVAYLEKIVSGVAAANSGTALSGSAGWVGCIATFKAPAAGGGQQLFTLINQEDY